MEDEIFEAGTLNPFVFNLSESDILQLLCKESLFTNLQIISTG